MPAGKFKRHFDTVMDKSKLIPSPDKYRGHSENFNDTTKHSKIYCHENENFTSKIIANAKKTPGVGRY